MILETTIKLKVNSEELAKEIIEAYREKANEGSYIIKKAGYERKEKKAKGEVIAEGFLVTIVQVYANFWDDI